MIVIKATVLKDGSTIEALINLSGDPVVAPAQMHDEFYVVIQEANPFIIAGPMVTDDLSPVTDIDPKTGEALPIMAVLTPGTLASYKLQDAMLGLMVDENHTLNTTLRLVPHWNAIWRATQKNDLAIWS